jgi:hypothetical protein
MDFNALVMALIPPQYVPLVHTVILGVMAAMVIAARICAHTNTPDPTSKLGKVYRVLEWVGQITEKTKQKGK